MGTALAGFIPKMLCADPAARISLKNILEAAESHQAAHYTVRLRNRETVSLGAELNVTVCGFEVHFANHPAETPGEAELQECLHLSLYSSGLTLVPWPLARLTLLVTSGSAVAVLDLVPLRALCALLANDSPLAELGLADQALEVLELRNTPLSLLAECELPRLRALDIRGCAVLNLCSESCPLLREVRFGFGQSLGLVPAAAELFFGDTRVPTEPETAPCGVRDTRGYLGDQFVSLGHGHMFTCDNQTYEFAQGSLSDHGGFDARNLYMCRFLNLRGAPFSVLDATLLFSLEHADISLTQLREADFRPCAHLKAVVADARTVVLAARGVSTSIFDSPEDQGMTESRVTASPGVYDTSAWRGEEKVCLGAACRQIALPDGTEVLFGGNGRLTGFNTLDERNLTLCRYLNLRDASIVRIETAQLSRMRVLVLALTNISSINTEPLLNIEYLDVSATKLQGFETGSLGKLADLDFSNAPIAHLNFYNLTSLERLNIRDTQIKFLDLTDL